MIKFPNGNEYKLVYLDTNAISEISKNYNNCFKNFFAYFNFFKNCDCEHYALVTSVYNLVELNKVREEYRNKIISTFDLIPVLITNGFPQLVITELNHDDFVLFATGSKPIMNNQFSTIFKQLNEINKNDKSFQQHLSKEIEIWNSERMSKKKLEELFEDSYSLYNTYNDDYHILYSAKCSKIFSFIKYKFLYDKNKPIDENSIVDTYNACIAPFVDIFIGERTVTSWLEMSKDKFDFMNDVKCIKISNFYDK